MEITKIDKNFIIETSMNLPDPAFYLPTQDPFRLLGVRPDGDRYARMPRECAQRVSDGVAWLCSNTAGGRVRFKTNSPYVGIVAELDRICKMSHIALSGSAGFDLTLYENGRQKHVASFIPPWDVESRFESSAYLDAGDIMKDLTLHFPLYSDVKTLYIVLKKDAEVLTPAPYKTAKPVVFYGSSITQGGCASRPSSCYQGVLSDRMDFDYINLGFSGSAKGETAMAEYIASLEMSAFVLDYDHNAETAEQLLSTHEPFFKIIRAAQPDLPILILSRPGCLDQSDTKMRREDDLARLAAVEKTYRNAVEAGDQNVWFINGMTLMDAVSGNGTVDKCHPTDAGFFAMASAIEPVLREMLQSK